MNYRLIVSAVAIMFAPMAFAAGDAAKGKTIANNGDIKCVTCHGATGNAPAGGATPSLAGQNEAYLVRQLSNFKSGVRADATMAGQVANLSEQDMMDVAAYFSQQKPATGGASDEGMRNTGKLIYQGGIPSKGVPACAGCHGPTGAGNPPAGYPSLSGQVENYTVATMKKFRDHERGAYKPKDSEDKNKDEHGKIMTVIAERMTLDEIKAVSHFIAGLH